MAQMGGTAMIKLLFLFKICSKIAALQGTTFSGYYMTTGFGPFKLQPVA